MHDAGPNTQTAPPSLSHRSGCPSSSLISGLCGRIAGKVFRHALSLAAACFIFGAVTAGPVEPQLLGFPQLHAQATPSPAAPAPPIVQGNYWALVIGINAYPNLSPREQLTAALPGAEAVARVLRQYGVERERITALYDARASRASVLEVLEGSFRREVAPGDSILIYFAGHCRTDGTTKEVWWLPADARENLPASYLAL
ncbi:MAG: caspase family protein, partial [Candidatus Methylomirabilota bacterium]